jgi:hypothetical protein
MTPAKKEIRNPERTKKDVYKIIFPVSNVMRFLSSKSTVNGVILRFRKNPIICQIAI